MPVIGSGLSRSHPRERPRLFGTKLARRAIAGAFIPAVDYIQAQRQRLKLTYDMIDSFRSFDAMVTLTTPGSAPIDRPEQGGRGLQPPSLTMPFSVTGFPALSIPTGFDRQSLPLAMQIVGKPLDEATVFRVGHAYEQATSWHKQRPALARWRSAPLGLAARCE